MSTSLSDVPPELEQIPGGSGLGSVFELEEPSVVEKQFEEEASKEFKKLAVVRQNLQKDLQAKF